MTNSNFKTIKISPELHLKIKNFCDKNGYKLNQWIEIQLLKIIDNKNEQNG